MPLYHIAKFLTNAPLIWRIGQTETVQLSIFARDIITVSAKIEMYNSAGAVIATDVLPGVIVDSRRFTITITPSSFSNLTAAYFKVWAEVAGIRKTEIRTYYIDRTVCANNTTVLWVNRLGGIDTYTFTGEQSWILEAQKMRSIRELNFPFSLQDTGTIVTGVFANENGELFSRFEKTDVIKWLTEIITSPAVWIKQVPLSDSEGEYTPAGAQRIPINVTIDSHAWKDQNELLQFKMVFEYANQINTQNG
jgi:hypothetical protein